MHDIPLQSNGGQWWAKVIPSAYDLPLPKFLTRASALRGLPFLQSGTTATLTPGDALLTGRYDRTGDMIVDVSFITADGELRVLDVDRALRKELRALPLPEPLRQFSGPLARAVSALWALRLGYPVGGDRMLKL